MKVSLIWSTELNIKSYFSDFLLSLKEFAIKVGFPFNSRGWKGWNAGIVGVCSSDFLKLEPQNTVTEEDRLWKIVQAIFHQR